MLPALFDSQRYAIATSSKVIAIAIIIKKEGVRMVVCQPGTTDVAVSKEKGIVRMNRAPNTIKGISGLFIYSMTRFMIYSPLPLLS